MTEEERGQIKTTCYTTLNDRLNNMTVYSPPPTNLQGRWGDLVEPQNRISVWDTGVALPLLQFVGAKSVSIPEEIHLHSHLMKTHVQVYRNRLCSPLTGVCAYKVFMMICVSCCIAFG